MQQIFLMRTKNHHLRGLINRAKWWARGRGWRTTGSAPLSTQGTHEHPTLLRRWVFLSKVVSAPAKLAVLYDQPSCPAPSLTHTHTTHTVGYSPGEHAAVMAEQIAMRELWAEPFQSRALRTGGLQVSLERSWPPADWGRGLIIESPLPVYLSVIGNDVFFIHPWGRPLLSPNSSEIHQSLHASVFVSLCLTFGFLVGKRGGVCAAVN